MYKTLERSKSQHKIVRQYNEWIDKEPLVIIVLAKSLLNELGKKNALSEYKDWITFFNKCLRGQVDANVILY